MPAKKTKATSIKDIKALLNKVKSAKTVETKPAEKKTETLDIEESVDILQNL
jgi:hypothetical protein